MSVEFLTDFLPREQIVVRPDHPLILRGPDALVGGAENLCAIFEPQSIELQNPSHLVTRLISARLALPRYTRTVLLLKRGQEARFSALEKEFGLTTDRADRALSSFLTSSRDFGRSRPMDPDSQASAIKSFERSMEIVNFAYRLERTVTARRGKSPPISGEMPLHRRLSIGPFHYSPRNRVSIEGVEASILHARSRSNLARQLNATLTGHLLETYYLDNGVPYPKGAMFTRMAAVAEADELLDHRSKQVYAAAFLGTALIPATSDVVLETASHYRDAVSGAQSGAI
ncbi:hypothetical protein CN176_03445 [Sinorhizobium medicae]|uniref:hypothetical protein n=1 Tax=Sinorhizobium medicae TaxID=110321 RepID=UPI000FD7EE81|nr:hypothetical protein [Sinorhizobium medicae]RVJ45852.1 hypothetical protein CN176_03445 [Sinorhizobium medicae]